MRKATPVGAPRDLLAGTKLAAMPGFAGRQTDTGEEIELEFTPDNSSLVFTASTNRHMAAYAFPDSQLFIADLAGGEPRQMTSGQDRWAMPRFTPNGRHAARRRRAAERPDSPTTRRGSRPCHGRETRYPRSSSNGLDRAVDTYAISPDSTRVYFTAEENGNSKLFSVRVVGGKVDTLFGVENGSYTNITIPTGARKHHLVHELGKRESPAPRSRSPRRWAARRSC